MDTTKLILNGIALSILAAFIFGKVSHKTALKIGITAVVIAQLIPSSTESTT